MSHTTNRNLEIRLILATTDDHVKAVERHEIYYAAKSISKSDKHLSSTYTHFGIEINICNVRI